MLNLHPSENTTGLFLAPNVKNLLYIIKGDETLLPVLIRILGSGFNPYISGIIKLGLLSKIKPS